MTRRWADELGGCEPLPALEPFFILAALEVGDPEDKGWLMNRSPAFHDLYRTYRRNMTECVRSPAYPQDGAAVLLQYIVWYDRESRRAKAGEHR